MTDQQLTHIDEQGAVRMVDVSQKADTERVAVAEGFIAMHPETLALIVEGKAAKGDVLACARVAGVMAAKQTSALIPMCHPLNITKAKVECAPVARGRARRRPRGHPRDHCTCGVTGKTGIEMEALTAASRGVPDGVRHVQGGGPRHGDHGRAPAEEGRRQDRSLAARKLVDRTHIYSTTESPRPGRGGPGALLMICGAGRDQARSGKGVGTTSRGTSPRTCRTRGRAPARRPKTHPGWG